MSKKVIQNSLIAIFLIILGTVPAFAQAVFGVGSTANTAADIGHAELAGRITMTVVSGTTAAASFRITYAAPITNNAASEIFISGFGPIFSSSPIALANPTLDRSTNSIAFDVPAGAASGERIQITGVRLDIAGHDFENVIATIDSPASGGNSIIAGQNKPIVISAIAEPFSVDQSVYPPLSFSNGVPINAATQFVVIEGYQNAFTTPGGTLGQTQATRVRLTPFPSIPAGVKLIFNPLAASVETGATLTTSASVSNVTLPRSDGSTDIVYEFNSTPDSPVTFESFRFYVSMTVDAPARTGKIQFQVAFVPIGLAKPNEQFPSTEIPRYDERLVPDESLLISGLTELAFPFQARGDNTYTGIALTNPQDFKVLATYTAYDLSGEMIAGDGITNPVTITLPRKGQYAKLASEIFGPRFNSNSAGTIRVDGKTEQLTGFYLMGDIVGPKLDGSTGSIDGLASWYLPLIYRTGTAPVNRLEIYNPEAVGTAAANLNLRLFDFSGKEIANTSQIIAPGATYVQEVWAAFGVNLSSFQGGYIRGLSDLPLVVRYTFYNELEFNVLDAQTPSSKTAFYVPHFATGGTYSTELTIVNASTAALADINVTLYNNSGLSYAVSGNPANITIPAGQQITRTLASLFPNLPSGLQTGSIRFDVKPVNAGPFVTTPPLAGAIRFSEASGSSAALPLSLTLGTDLIYSHVAQSLGYYTGVAMMNPNTDPTSIELDVYTRDGKLVGFYSTLLQPGQRITKLVEELVPASAGQLGGYVRLTSSASIVSFSLFGTNDGRSLSAIPPQTMK
jgi:hypothetical protein